MWSKDRWGATRTGWALVLVSLIFVFLGVRAGLDAVPLAFWGVVTEGQVVAVREETRHGKGGAYVVYFPTVSFEDQRGVTYLHEASDERTKRQVGSIVPVLYLADDPKRFHVNDHSVWDNLTGHFCFACCFSFAGVVLVLLGRALQG